MKPYACVLGLYYREGLATIRCLGKAGIPLDGYHLQDRYPAAKHSRYLSNSGVCKSESKLLSMMVEDGKKHDAKQVVFAAGDDYVWFLYKNQEVLSTYYDLPLSEKYDMETLMSKKEILTIGEKAGFKAPKTQFLSDEKLDFDDAVLVKPVNSIKYNKRHFRKFASLKELMGCRDQLLMEYGSDILVQEFVDGCESPVQIQAYNSSQGPVIAGMDQRCISFYQYKDKDIPMTAFLESVWIEDLVEPAKALTSEIGLKGPINIEIFPDGTLIEVNLRGTYIMEFDQVKGFNLPAFVYKDKTGDDITEIPDGKKHKGKKFATDIAVPLFFWHNQKNQLGKLVDLYKNSQVVNGFFHFDDPLPDIFRYFAMSKRLDRLFSHARGGIEKVIMNS